MKTLIIFAHTFWEESKVNKTLLASIEDMQDVAIHNLSTIYKDGKIDVNKELSLLKEASKIIFQFPLFWFSTPALLKEWQDRVLLGVLHSKNSNLLKGKKFQIITTLGGAKSSYDGHHGYALDTLLSPLYSSFKYCGCESMEYFAIFSANTNDLNLEAYKNAILKV